MTLLPAVRYHPRSVAMPNGLAGLPRAGSGGPHAADLANADIGSLFDVMDDQTVQVATANALRLVRPDNQELL